MTEPRDKAEGWYLLHDMRRLDWPEVKSMTDGERREAVEELESEMESMSSVDEGDTALYAVPGDKADLMFIHVRPTPEEIDHAERRLESTAFADVTEQTTSFVSVAEVGGYTNEDVENDELSPYAEKKLFPSIPDRRYVSFYPMSRKRDPEQNWYTLPLEHRNEMMHEHRESGENYAGRIEQLISGSIGLDDWEWGVDLFTDDLVNAKQIVYEMRFDEASAVYSEFGSFYVGYALEPRDLDDYLAGELLLERDGTDDGGSRSIRDELREQGVYAGQPHGEDVHALVLPGAVDAEALGSEVGGLRGNFDHYDSHVETEVYEGVDGGRPALVSVWETESAAETAAGYLSDLEGVGEADEGDGFATMGMFYRVKSEHNDDFRSAFDDVLGLLDDMDGHRETRLLANVDDEDDMFIESRWDSRDDAMEFFRSQEFRDTVDWGREILEDTPRHVFLA